MNTRHHEHGSLNFKLVPPFSNPQISAGTEDSIVSPSSPNICFGLNENAFGFQNSLTCIFVQQGKKCPEVTLCSVVTGVFQKLGNLETMPPLVCRTEALCSGAAGRALWPCIESIHCGSASWACIAHVCLKCATWPCVAPMHCNCASWPCTASVCCVCASWPCMVTTHCTHVLCPCIVAVHCIDAS